MSYEIQIDGKSQQVKRDTLNVEFMYPRSEGQVKAVTLGLSDVRAADDIRIFYDFDRDGYAIQQASIFVWDADDKVCDQDWQEVAFVRAWAREKAPT